MKKIFSSAVLFFCLCLLSASPSQANETDGFRGVHWGERLGSFAHMKFIDELDGLRYYKKMNDEMHIGGAGLIEIAYAFDSGTFVGVVVSSKGKDNAHLLFETLKQAYGTPSKRNNDNYYWRFSHLSIFYNYNPHSQRLFVSYLTEPAIGKLRRAGHR